MKPSAEMIAEIRGFNRFYTNLLGLLNQNILHSSYSLTETRILFEIGQQVSCSAHLLAEELNIDRSYMSRVIRRFERDGLITRKASSIDGRVQHIRLTEKGTETIEELDQRADQQLHELLSPLQKQSQEEIVNAMVTIHGHLQEASAPVRIRAFIPQDIEYVIERHRTLYQVEYGLSPMFGEYVEQIVRKFAQQYNPEKECLLIPERDGKPVGSIAVAMADEKTAQLRYFLLEPEIRGRGVGKQLIRMALDFCRSKGYRHVFLTTISALKTARHLYHQNGFTLTQTQENTSWGQNVLEERWDLDLE